MIDKQIIECLFNFKVYPNVPLGDSYASLDSAIIAGQIHESGAKTFASCYDKQF